MARHVSLLRECQRGSLLKSSAHSFIADKSFANEQQLDMSSNVRLVYGGRIYQDREILESHPFWDFANDYVINALVLE
jgi:hypothetical protein